MPFLLTCTHRAWERGWLLGGLTMAITKMRKGRRNAGKERGAAETWQDDHSSTCQPPASEQTQVLSCPYGASCNSNRIYAPSI